MKLKVIDDTTEREIALIQTYNSVLAKHEHLLQIVENCRQRFLNPIN